MSNEVTHGPLVLENWECTPISVTVADRAKRMKFRKWMPISETVLGRAKRKTF